METVVDETTAGKVGRRPLRSGAPPLQMMMLQRPLFDSVWRPLVSRPASKSPEENGGGGCFGAVEAIPSNRYFDLRGENSGSRAVG